MTTQIVETAKKWVEVNFLMIIIGIIGAFMVFAVTYPLFFAGDAGERRATDWNVISSPKTGHCYEVVSVPRAADLVYPIADEYCNMTISGEK